MTPKRDCQSRTLWQISIQSGKKKLQLMHASTTKIQPSQWHSPDLDELPASSMNCEETILPIVLAVQICSPSLIFF